MRRKYRHSFRSWGCISKIDHAAKQQFIVKWLRYAEKAWVPGEGRGHTPTHLHHFREYYDIPEVTECSYLTKNRADFFSIAQTVGPHAVDFILGRVEYDVDFEKSQRDDTSGEILTRLRPVAVHIGVNDHAADTRIGNPDIIVPDDVRQKALALGSAGYSLVYVPYLKVYNEPKAYTKLIDELFDKHISQRHSRAG